jgi:LytS/YehU family sensor histidine kinase
VGVLLTCLYVFYSHFFLLTRYSGKGKRGVYFRQLAAIVLTGPLPFLFFHPRGLEDWPFDINYYFMTLVSAVPLFLFLSWLARVTENLVLNTIRKEQLEKQAVEAELYYLRSQINPHFLFNTLNNIHTLVYKQAPAAPEAVMRLASLMRYMIYESNAALVPLTREVDYLQDYVSLQQLRYRKSPVVDLTMEGDTASCHIAPLLFIHLIENAYKHSPARLEPGDIRLNIEVEANSLTFSLQNPVAGRQEGGWEGPGGIGLPNVRKRLALLYPNRHSLEAVRTGEVFQVVLKIQGIHAQSDDAKNHLLYH